MVLSRGLLALRAARFMQRGNIQTIQSVRNSSHQCNYRSPGEPPSKGILLVAELVQGVAWWWVLWHLWTEPEHITGEFVYPDPRKWTDEELGVPALN